MFALVVKFLSVYPYRPESYWEDIEIAASVSESKYTSGLVPLFVRSVNS